MIKLIQDQVLVRPTAVAEKVGSFYIPQDKDDKRPTNGEVLAVGPGKYRNDILIQVDVSVGSQVMWEPYSGNDVEVDGEMYLLLREDKILGEVK